MPVGVRHVESIIRMSEAHAKMHLRDYVNEDDVNVAIRVMLNSFIGAQKMSIARTLNKHFRRYVTYKKDSNELLFYVLQTLVQETTNFLTFAGRASENVIRIDVEELVTRAQELNISDLQPFFHSDLFRLNGFVYNSATKEIVKSFN
jgi:DNA replication licensing factor MCM2